MRRQADAQGLVTGIFTMRLTPFRVARRSILMVMLSNQRETRLKSVLSSAQWSTRVFGIKAELIWISIVVLVS